MTWESSQRDIALGVGVIALIVFSAVFAAQLAPHDPGTACLSKRLSSPSWDYPLGTDSLGRCILSRMLFGARFSLSIGLTVVFFSALIGLILGSIAGYNGGLVDEIIMRIVDGFLAVPSMFLALAVVGFLGPGLANVILALVVVEWTSFARVVRGEVLSLKGKEFLEAARSLGASDVHVFVRHLLPNILAPVLVVATLGISNAVLAAAELSFLGLGVQPGVPEWGSMLSDGRLYLRTAPYIMIFPGLAITLTVLAFNMLGEGLGEKLDPRRRGKGAERID
jgi:peptide/nickel transport system permease protein